MSLDGERWETVAELEISFTKKAHAQKHQILRSSTVSLSTHYKGMSSV